MEIKVRMKWKLKQQHNNKHKIWMIMDNDNNKYDIK